MAWVKFDDQFDDNPEIDLLDPAALALFLCMNTWSARNKTDGVVPAERVRKLPGAEHIESLCQGIGPVDWVIRCGRDYVIRNFLKYNPSQADLAAKRAETARRVAEYRRGHKEDTPEPVTPAVTHDVTPLHGTLHEPKNGDVTPHVTHVVTHDVTQSVLTHARARPVSRIPITGVNYKQEIYESVGRVPRFAGSPPSPESLDRLIADYQEHFENGSFMRSIHSACEYACGPKYRKSNQPNVALFLRNWLERDLKQRQAKTQHGGSRNGSSPQRESLSQGYERTSREIEELLQRGSESTAGDQ